MENNNAANRDNIFINVCQMISDNLHAIHPEAVDCGVFIRIAANPATGSLQMDSLNVYRTSSDPRDTVTISWQFTNPDIYRQLGELWTATDRGWFNAMICINLATGRITTKFIPKADPNVPWMYKDSEDIGAEPEFDYLTIKRPYLDTARQLNR